MEAGISYKLYNDKITLTKFCAPVMLYKPLDDWHKIEIATGEVSRWNYGDTLRHCRNFHSSLSRTRRTINELSEKNKFDYFLTITFNKKYVDRKSALFVHAKFKNIIKRLKYYYGRLEYISVAEYHEDNEGIHYHVMINFENTPKLRYFKHSAKGHAMYYIIDNFKKNDCFLIVEKLKENNVEYLTKYITKGYDFPLHRKFSATRGLNRSRLEKSLYLNEKEFDCLSWYAERKGFNIKFKCTTNATLQYSITSAAPAAEVDLLRIDTKDENLENFFYKFINNFEHNKKQLRKFVKKYRKKQ